MLDKIKRFLKKLVLFGVDKNLPYLELRKVMFLNVIVFSITFILFIFFVINIFLESYFLAFSDIACIILVCVPSWYLQYKRYYHANLMLITSAFFVYTVVITILHYDFLRQTEHILIPLSIMPIFLFDGWRKNLMFSFFPLSFFVVRFVVMYQTQGVIEIYPMHIIYAICFLIVYVMASYFKDDMIHFYTLLNNSNKTKDKLFSIISHDIRNPFSSLLGSSDLQMKYLETKNFEKFEKTTLIINSASKKIYDLTQTLLDWSQTQSETFIVKKEKTDLTDLVKQIVDFCNISARPKEVNIEFNPQKQIIVSCDIIMTQITVRNIIMNAIKFSHRNSSVLIEVVETEKSVEIIVSDSGIGISAEVLATLFDENLIQSQYGTEREKGTGLGLMISKEFIEKQNGSIQVKSTLGEGSVFTISIPKINL